jgi:hypothetical protein
VDPKSVVAFLNQLMGKIGSKDLGFKDSKEIESYFLSYLEDFTRNHELFLESEGYNSIENYF